MRRRHHEKSAHHALFSFIREASELVQNDTCLVRFVAIHHLLQAENHALHREMMRIRNYTPGVHAFNDSAMIGFKLCNLFLLLLLQLGQLTLAFFQKFVLHSLTLLAELSHRNFSLRYCRLQRFDLGGFAFQFRLGSSDECGKLGTNEVRQRRTLRSLIEASADFCAVLAVAKSERSLVICSDVDEDTDADSAIALV